MLVLQLAVVTSVAQTVPSPASPPESSAPPAAGMAAPESSQTQGQRSQGGPANGATTQPGKAGGQGDPAFGGERHPFYRLSKSDTVDVNFTFSPDFNQTLSVLPDGFVIFKCDFQHQNQPTAETQRHGENHFKFQSTRLQ